MGPGTGRERLASDVPGEEADSTSLPRQEHEGAPPLWALR